MAEQNPRGNAEKLKDAYAEYLFHKGQNFKAYEYLGARRARDGFLFRLWAPNADEVFLAGDFNGWSESLPLKKITRGGIWAVFSSGAEGELAGFGEGSRYKFIIRRGGKTFYKSDPYAFYSETKADTASLFFERGAYQWGDGAYLEQRRRLLSGALARDQMPPCPLNIYEVHLGSWKRHGDGAYYTYDELAEELSEYVLRQGYTHIEIMPVTEHPYDGSWGYQVCGYYAPTSRFGDPRGFSRFVDRFHQKGIGVILDWVPSHFPKDAHGLYEFDGAPLYEYQGQDRMEHKGWGTRAFDVGREEVKAFLISNADFWLREYHIDGLRVDAVASMLYLDYGRDPGEWFPNPDGGNINPDAVEFFKTLNAHIKKEHPDVLMIAEESTAYPGVTKKEGLGFHLKWNMGFMNDTLSYIGADFSSRCAAHHKMTFSTSYAFSENYVLPISHDEVVHGKKSLIDKMFGAYEQKFSALRAYFMWMFAHPGKKLLFMGSEFGQFREWDYASSLEWFMLDYPKHQEIWEFTRALNHFYKKTPALWENDGEDNSFLWLDADRGADRVYLFERIDLSGSRLVCVFNFSPEKRESYPIYVTEGGWYREVFASAPRGKARAERAVKAGNQYLLKIELPPLWAGFFQKTPVSRQKAKKSPKEKGKQAKKK